MLVTGDGLKAFLLFFPWSVICHWGGVARALLLYWKVELIFVKQKFVSIVKVSPSCLLPLVFYARIVCLLIELDADAYVSRMRWNDLSFVCLVSLSDTLFVQRWGNLHRCRFPTKWIFYCKSVTKLKVKSWLYSHDF